MENRIQLNSTQPFPSRINLVSGNKPGTSMIELMSVIIVLTLVLTGVYSVFRGGQRGAGEAMQNHIINEEAQKIVDYLTNDIREAGSIDPNLPPLTPSSDIAKITTDSPTNALFFTKYYYDFSKNPALLVDGQVNFTQSKIQYSLEKEDLTSATSAYVLIRRETPWDDMRKAKVSEIKIRPLTNKLENFIFYRILPLPTDNRGMGARNIYFKFLITRRDKKSQIGQKYSTEITTSVAIRGAEPE